MLRSFEDVANEAALKRGVDLAALCRACFMGKAGVELLSALGGASHPFAPPVGADALETYRLIGRAEVVNLLLRLSDSQVSPGKVVEIIEPTT